MNSWVTVHHKLRYGIWDTMGCELYLNLPKDRAQDVANYFNKNNMDGRRLLEDDIYKAIGKALLESCGQKLG